VCDGVFECENEELSFTDSVIEEDKLHVAEEVVVMDKEKDDNVIDAVSEVDFEHEREHVNETERVFFVVVVALKDAE
jgi:putative cell wall-binding protein